jgi:predicted amidophosphoribosyltransferase
VSPKAIFVRTTYETIRGGQAVPAGGKFCPGCGKKMETGGCAGCGKPVPTGAKFCPHCGAKQS